MSNLKYKGGPPPPDRSNELVAKISLMMAETDYSIADWVSALGSLLTILFIRSSPTQADALNKSRLLRENMRRAIPQYWGTQKAFVAQLEQQRAEHNGSGSTRSAGRTGDLQGEGTHPEDKGKEDPSS